MTSCLQKYNSQTLDNSVERKSENLSGPGVYSLLEKRCINCHTGYHQGWSRFTENQNWIDTKLIIKGDSISSLLINKLNNTGGNMPLNGQSLSEEEFDTLSDWIDRIDEN